MINLKKCAMVGFVLVVLIVNKSYSAEAALNNLLINATYLGQAGKVQELLGQGADARFKNVAGETPLIIAAANGDTSIVSILISHDLGTKNDTDNGGHTALWHAQSAKQDRINLPQNPRLEMRKIEYSLIIDALS